MTATLGFLNLPAELRLQIYRHISPTNLSFSCNDYQGFYTSCKTIKHEMDVECSRPIRGELQKLRQDDRIFLLDEGYFNGTRYAYNPTKFWHLNDVRLNIYVDLARLLQEYTNPSFNQASSFDNIIEPLAHWPITSLAIHLRNDRKSRKERGWQETCGLLIIHQVSYPIISRVCTGSFDPRASNVPLPPYGLGVYNKRLRSIVVDGEYASFPGHTYTWICGTSGTLWSMRESSPIGCDAAICKLVWVVGEVGQVDVEDARDEETRQSIRRFDRFCEEHGVESSTKRGRARRRGRQVSDKRWQSHTPTR